MKKPTAFFFALLLLVLTGCEIHGPAGYTEPSIDPTVETTLIRPPEPTDYPLTHVPESDELPVIRVQYLPERMGSGNVPVLKWVCLTEYQDGCMDRVWSEDAVLELNDMLDQMGAGFRIQFVMLSADRYISQYDWFSRTEVLDIIADADLIYGYMEEAAMLQYLTPITQYVKGTNAVLENAVPHSAFWHASTLNGEVYGIFTDLYLASCSGWMIDESFLAELDLGLTAADFQKNFWEMDEIFEKIASVYNEPFLCMLSDGVITSSGFNNDDSYIPRVLDGYMSSVHNAGSCFAVDYSGDSPQIVNYLEMEEIRLFQQAVIRYKKAGYVVDEDDAQRLCLQYTTLLCSEAYSQDGQQYIPVTQPLFYMTGVGGNISGIAATSEHIEEAVSLLALIANDETFRFHLFFGQEGRDYTVEDGCYSIMKREDGSDYSMDFLSSLSYFCGLTQGDMTDTSRTLSTLNAYLTGDSSEEKLRLLCKTLDDSRMRIPVAFDLTDCEEEAESVAWVLKRYFPYMSNEKHIAGSLLTPAQPEMTPALYDLMLKDLENAGSVILQQELQAQLDDWLKENPDW